MVISADRQRGVVQAHVKFVLKAQTYIRPLTFGVL